MSSRWTTTVRGVISISPMVREAWLRFAWAGWIVCGLAACAPKKGAPLDGGAAADAAVSARVDDAGPDAGGPEALRDGILDCTFSERIGFTACAPAETLARTAKDSPTGMATLLDWVGDKSAPIRSSAAHALYAGKFPQRMYADCTGGARVKAALDKELVSVNAWQLAYAWSKFVEQCPEQDAATQSFVKDAAYPHAQARGSLLSILDADILHRPGWFDTLAGLVRDEQTDSHVRQSAAQVMWKLPTEKKPEIIPVLRTALTGKDGAVAARAAGSLASLDVDAAFPAVLQAAKADVAAGGKHSQFIWALISYVQKNPKDRGPRVAALAKSTAQGSTLDSLTRHAALKLLDRLHTEDARKTLQTIAASTAPEDKSLARDAEKLLADWASADGGAPAK